VVERTELPTKWKTPSLENIVIRILAGETARTQALPSAGINTRGSSHSEIRCSSNNEAKPAHKPQRKLFHSLLPFLIHSVPHFGPENHEFVGWLVSVVYIGSNVERVSPSASRAISDWDRGLPQNRRAGVYPEHLLLSRKIVKGKRYFIDI